MKSQQKDSEFTLNIEEINKLINSSKNMRDKCIIESLYYAGMRRFEVAKMIIGDIDFERGRIRVIGKGGKLAIIPVGALFPQYMTDLKFFIGKRVEGPVFLNNRKGQMNISRINQLLDETAKIAHITNPNPKKKHVNPHILRHSIARHLKRLRFPLEYIQKYLRHSSMQTTADEYGTLSIEEMEQISNQSNSVSFKQLQ